MAYAAYLEHGAVLHHHQAYQEDEVHVLDVVVPCTLAGQVRRQLAQCDGVGVLRCEPLLHALPNADDDALRVRLMVRLPLSRHAAVLHLLMECMESGEIGRLVSWREHLARCGLRHGG